MMVFGGGRLDVCNDVRYLRQPNDRGRRHHRPGEDIGSRRVSMDTDRHDDHTDEIIAGAIPRSNSVPSVQIQCRAG